MTDPIKDLKKVDRVADCIFLIVVAIIFLTAIYFGITHHIKLMPY